jgi:hypothetical protein
MPHCDHFMPRLGHELLVFGASSLKASRLRAIIHQCIDLDLCGLPGSWTCRRRKFQRATHAGEQGRSTPLNESGLRPWEVNQAAISALPNRSVSESASRLGRP